MLTDTHCHIFKSDYENIDEVIKRAKENNVTRFINNATNLNSCHEVLELSQKYRTMYGALGIHPEDVESYQESDLKFIEANLVNPKVVAIGEIGLDYYYTKDNKAKQIELFEKQLAMAQEYEIPVIIHNREATGDILNSLKKFKVKGIIHCFNGSLETAQEYLKMGFKLGINGVVTFKNCKLKEVLKQLSINDLVLETDSPYLAPVPLRGEKNEPKNIKIIAEFLADLYNISLSQVEIITNRNIGQIFDI